MAEYICTQKHQTRRESGGRPVWIRVGEVVEFKNPPAQFFELLDTTLRNPDLMTLPEELLLEGRVPVDTIKLFMKDKFNVDLGGKQLKSCVRELIYARNNIGAVVQPGEISGVTKKKKEEVKTEQGNEPETGDSDLDDLR